jgi:hypothetical protein
MLLAWKLLLEHTDSSLYQRLRSRFFMTGDKRDDTVYHPRLERNIQ